MKIHTHGPVEGAAIDKAFDSALKPDLSLIVSLVASCQNCSGVRGAAGLYWTYTLGKLLSDKDAFKGDLKASPEARVMADLI